MLVTICLVQSSHWEGETVPPEFDSQDKFGGQSLCRPCSPLENSQILALSSSVGLMGLITSHPGPSSQHIQWFTTWALGQTTKVAAVHKVQVWADHDQGL